MLSLIVAFLAGCEGALDERSRVESQARRSLEKRLVVELQEQLEQLQLEQRDVFSLLRQLKQRIQETRGRDGDILVALFRDQIEQARFHKARIAELIRGIEKDLRSLERAALRGSL